jgi:predicted CoA-substrate-specific enzyme activase
MKWNINEITDARVLYVANKRPLIGLDLGSRASKGVLLTKGDIFTVLIPTGLYMQETADELIGKLLSEAGVSRAELGGVVATGYGRIALKFNDIPFEVVTEITCHAMGAHALRPGTRTIIDIGGQDSKAIKVDPATGKVVDFVMNDKCAAGTGRFLEKAAALLGLQLYELGAVALRSKNPVPISSQCVVFAESEMVSLRARGERQGNGEALADIASGIHYSAGRRVRNLLGRIGMEPELVFTGGVSNNPGMRHALEDLIGSKFCEVKFDLIFAGALGAAVYAGKLATALVPTAQGEEATGAAAAAFAQALIASAQAAFLSDAEQSQRVGYLCAYTPLELLNAAGVRHMRLFKAGDPETVARGELYTQSVFCDFSKSCLGGFTGSDPLYKSIDKVYNFHTCASMKRVSEVIGEFVSTELLNLPKLRDLATSRCLFREEIVSMRDDLALLTGRAIEDESVRVQIRLYNQARQLLKRISELRKRASPPLSGGDYLELVRGFYHLPPETLLREYGEIYRKLDAVSPGGSRPIRLMVSGSVMAEGDRRILDIIECELGARVVVEDHCTGLKPVYHTLSESGDVWKALADGYIDQAPCARMKPLDDSVTFSGRLAQEYAVDGVLYVYLKFCACYGVSKGSFIEHFNQLGLPVLDISSDYSQSDYGQFKTRLEAFVEVLRERVAEKSDSKNNNHADALNS